MESTIPNNLSSAAAANTTTNLISVSAGDINKKVLVNGLQQKKKRSPMQFVKVAMYMLRRKSGKSKSVHVDVASKGMLSKVVGSMRPFHLQPNASPPAQLKGLTVDSPADMVKMEEVFTPPMSPDMASTSSSACSSRYASAVNLTELDNKEGDCEENGDGEIDAKAEEFIARFYEQMRLQRTNSMDLYHERTLRSIA